MTTGKRSRYLSGLGFTDLLFNTLIGFVFLFVIAFLLIAPPVPTDKKIDPKAEVLIILTWPEGNMSDIDLWVKDPTGLVVSFRGRDKGLMHLDRDDLGNSNDTLILADGRVIKSEQNQEIVTIRGWIPGEWVINIHFYAFRPGILGNSSTANSISEDELRIPITVELIRINPYKSKGVAKFDLIKTGQEKTAFNFTVMERTYRDTLSDGTVVEKSEYWMDEITTIMTPFIYEHKLTNTYYEDPNTGNLVQGTGPGAADLPAEPVPPLGSGN